MSSKDESPNYAYERKMALNRDEYECQFCGMSNAIHNEMYDKDLDVHHILPERQGGSDHRKNLITLCKSCHGQLETLTRQLLRIYAHTGGMMTETGGMKKGARSDELLQEIYDEVEEADLERARKHTP